MDPHPLIMKGQRTWWLLLTSPIAEKQMSIRRIWRGWGILWSIMEHYGVLWSIMEYLVFVGCVFDILECIFCYWVYAFLYSGCIWNLGVRIWHLGVVYLVLWLRIWYLGLRIWYWGCWFGIRGVYLVFWIVYLVFSIVYFRFGGVYSKQFWGCLSQMIRMYLVWIGESRLWCWTDGSCRREVYGIAAGTGVTIFIVPIWNYVVTSPH